MRVEDSYISHDEQDADESQRIEQHVLLQDAGGRADVEAVVPLELLDKQLVLRDKPESDECLHVAHDRYGDTDDDALVGG
jgi:hypothetical protein